MTEDQLIITELSARFMVAHIAAGGSSLDTAYAVRCFNLARTIILNSRDFK
jgi:hypothetical protein